jgi:CSLREA domain-containing protein
VSKEKEKMQAARALIQGQHYDEAREILNTIDHPKAQEWLAKLDEITLASPWAKQSNTGRRIIVSSVTLSIILFVLLGLLFATGVLSTDEDAVSGAPTSAADILSSSSQAPTTSLESTAADQAADTMEISETPEVASPMPTSSQLSGTPMAEPEQSTATIIVNTLDDVPRGCPENCTLRSAIITAQSGDVIGFTDGLTGTISLVQVLTVDKDLTIVGHGPSLLVIDGADQIQLLSIRGVTVEISGLAFQGAGNSAISNMGTLAITNSTFYNNSAESEGGGITNLGNGTLTITNTTFYGNSAESGGGIANTGALTIANSTFYGNSAEFGGGIANTGALTITNSTFYGNFASFSGGGIANTGTLIIANSTLSGNSANRIGGGIDSGETQQQLIILSTLIAGNEAAEGANVSGSVASLGNNLIGDPEGSVGWFSIDLQNSDPMLEPLADNGGQTQTIALREDSLAIGAGYCDGDEANSIPSVTTDQRGAQRKSECDIGAYESGAEAPESDPHPSVVESVSTYNLEEANLIVSTLTGSNSIVLTGGEVLASYILRVENVGSTDAGAFNVTITYPNGDVFDFTVASLAAGQETEIPNVTAIFTTPGTHRLTVFVDSSGNVTESNKNDNLAFLDITVIDQTLTRNPELETEMIMRDLNRIISNTESELNALINSKWMPWQSGEPSPFGCAASTFDNPYTGASAELLAQESDLGNIIQMINGALMTAQESADLYKTHCDANTLNQAVIADGLTLAENALENLQLARSELLALNPFSGCPLNQEVVVFGTGGVGLNLHDEPGGEVSFTASEGDRMMVIDGPIFFDDVEWCQVRSMSQSSNFGWITLEFVLDAAVIDE